MTKVGQYRATKAILSNRTEFGKLFPKVWIVGDSVFFTRNAAKRAKDCSIHPIEELSITEAYEHAYSKKMDIEDYRENVDVNIDQEGALYSGRLYSPIEYIPTYLRK